MSKRGLGLLLGCLAVTARGVVALDSPACPTTRVVSSADGHCYARFEVSADKPWDESACVVTAYRIGPGGKDSQLWRTQGWYAFAAWLSNDGHYLARLGPWPSGGEPKSDDLAVAFYDDGDLLRSWSTRDLIHDDSLVQRSASHYEYLDWTDSPRVVMTNKGEQLRLKTIDGLVYSFRLATGDIRTIEPAAPPPSQAEQNADLQARLAFQFFFAHLGDGDWNDVKKWCAKAAVISTQWTPPGSAKPELRIAAVKDWIHEARRQRYDSELLDDWIADGEFRRLGDVSVGMLRRSPPADPTNVRPWMGTLVVTMQREADDWTVVSVAWGGG